MGHHGFVERRNEMRHFTAIIAVFVFLSFTAGGAFAGQKENKANKVNNGKKIELTEQEMDSVTAGLRIPLPPGLPPSIASHVNGLGNAVGQIPRDQLRAHLMHVQSAFK
jgi:hypothetical protein